MQHFRPQAVGDGKAHVGAIVARIHHGAGRPLLIRHAENPDDLVGTQTNGCDGIYLCLNKIRSMQCV